MVLSGALAPNRTAVEVAGYIRELIQCGDLTMGERLPSQRELAASLGVGRAALREALAVLEQEGYVATRRGAHGGSFIRELAQPAALWLERMRGNVAEVDEIIDFRIAVESRAAALAAQRRTDGDLRELAEATRELRPGMDRAAFRAADARFHSALARASRNSRLAAAVRRARGELFLPTDELGWPAAVGVTRRQHAAILRAVEAGDPSRAARAATAHLERTRADFSAIFLAGES